MIGVMLRKILNPTYTPHISQLSTSLVSSLALSRPVLGERTLDIISAVSLKFAHLLIDCDLAR